jgi:hypothetical protein
VVKRTPIKDPEIEDLEISFKKDPYHGIRHDKSLAISLDTDADTASY